MISPHEEARRKEALPKALEWAHVVTWQARRLHDAESKALASNELVRWGATYTHNHSRPFFELRAEKHFLLIGARQLLRALKIYGDRKRVPAPRHDPQVMVDLRNALEHWDGAASDSFETRRGASADAHQWGEAGLFSQVCWRSTNLQRGLQRSRRTCWKCPASHNRTTPPARTRKRRYDAGTPQRPRSCDLV